MFEFRDTFVLYSTNKVRQHLEATDITAEIPDLTNHYSKKTKTRLKSYVFKEQEELPILS